MELSQLSPSNPTPSCSSLPREVWSVQACLKVLPPQPMWHQWESKQFPATHSAQPRVVTVIVLEFL